MEIDKMEDEFQLMYFASIIVDGAFDFFKIEQFLFHLYIPQNSLHPGEFCGPLFRYLISVSATS